jgi:oligopeptide transport system ATP-binding protein
MAEPVTATLAKPKSANSPPLLDVRDLKVHFPFHRGGLFSGKSGFVRAVDGVSFTLEKGKTLCLVGESGCGKSTTARGILNLVKPTSGEVWLNGERIDGLSEDAMRPFRREMQMIFQDPFASLNPRMPVGKIIREPMDIFGLLDYQDRRLEVMRLMDLVGLNPRFVNRYPH